MTGPAAYFHIGHGTTAVNFRLDLTPQRRESREVCPLYVRNGDTERLIDWIPRDGRELMEAEPAAVRWLRGGLPRQRRLGTQRGRKVCIRQLVAGLHILFRFCQRNSTAIMN